MPIRGVTTTAGRLAGGDDPRARAAHREAVLVPGDTQRLTELPGPGAELAVGLDATALPHRREPLHRLERAEEHRAAWPGAPQTRLAHQCMP